MILIRIIQGWFYYFFKSRNIENIAANRISICVQCKYSKFYSWEDEWKHKDLGYPKNPNDIYCSKCLRCPISKKTRSPKEKCPVGHW
jgi:hypothetical protein